MWSDYFKSQYTLEFSHASGTPSHTFPFRKFCIMDDESFPSSIIVTATLHGIRLNQPTDGDWNPAGDIDRGEKRIKNVGIPVKDRRAISTLEMITG